MKRLYDSILRPELVQDETLAPEPSTKSEKGVTGKKGEEKSAGGKKSGKEKEKKGAKPKEEPVKETPTGLCVTAAFSPSNVSVAMSEH